MTALNQLRDAVGKTPAGEFVKIAGPLLGAACDEIAAPLDRRRLRGLHHAAHAADGADVLLSIEEAQFLLLHLPPASAEAATDKPAEPAATPAETAG